MDGVSARQQQQQVTAGVGNFLVTFRERRPHVAGRRKKGKRKGYVRRRK